MGIAKDRTRFVGRARERESLGGQLLAGSRILTIAGPSGMGKTRLARQVMADCGSHFAEGGGAKFCDLASCRSASDLQAVVARELGIPQQGSALARTIANRGPLLLVLDNLETILDEAVPQIASWIDHGSELQILATSLLPMGLEGEVRFELGPLEPDDAVDLYLARARAAWADRDFPEREHPTVHELVGRLDRIPLAIELAAARIRVLSPKAMLSRIAEERFAVLTARTAGRHRSLLEALALTWEILEPEEQVALARSSVFDGGFDLRAAEAVLGDGEVDVLSALEGLREKALLQLDGDRFSLYESVKELAAAELERIGEGEVVVRRHALHFVERSEEEASRCDGPHAPEAARALGADRENLAAAHRRFAGPDPRLSARAGLALSVVLSLEGPPASEMELLDGTVSAARSAGDPLLLVESLRARAVASKRHGRIDEALRDLAEGLRLARAEGARSWEGWLLAESGSARTRIARLDEALDELSRAARIAGEVKDPRLEAFVLSMIGAAEEARASLETSAASFERAVEFFRRKGSLRHLGVALLGLGLVRSGQARFREARAATKEALEVFRALGHRASEADAIANLGSIELTAGILDEAEDHCRRALALERALGNRRFEALTLGNLGILALERGELRLAEQRLLEALAILRETGDLRFHALYLCFLAAAEAMLGRPAEARASISSALAAFDGLGDRRSPSVAHMLEGVLELGEARSVAGDAAAAAHLRERARARLDRQADPPTESLILARRLLEKALARKEDAAKVPAPGTPSGLIVGPEAAWFEMEGRRVDLRRRAAARRILLGLVEQRLLAPGVGIGQKQIFAIGWPGEDIQPDAAATRVYTTVRVLRSLGLAAALLRHGDGYLLEPKLPVSVATD